MAFTLTFFELAWLMLKITAPIWLLFIVLVVALGQIAGRIERWPPLSALYWSFVTATTVGYGDIRPASRGARVLAVVIALCGLVLFGVIVAIAVQATTQAVRVHGELGEIRALID